MASFQQIPSLPSAIALNGTEQIWAIQQGSDVKVTVSQIMQLAAAGGTVFLNVGITQILNSTSGRVLFANAGVLGQYAISGGGSVAMTVSPVFTTPNIGAATGTSLALSGALTAGSVSAATVAAPTSLTSPLLIGGVGTTGVQLTIKSTTGAGSTDQINIVGGNNGAQTWASLNGNGATLTSFTNGSHALTLNTSGAGTSDNIALQMNNPIATASAAVGFLASVGVAGAVNLGGMLWVRNGAALDSTGQLYSTDAAGTSQIRLQVSSTANGAGNGLLSVSGAISASSSITSSLFIGGAATNQQLALKTTTGAGTADFLTISGGNNGAQQWALFAASGINFTSFTASQRTLTLFTSGGGAGDQTALGVVNPSAANSATVGMAAYVGVAGGVQLGTLLWQRNVAGLDGTIFFQTNDTAGTIQTRATLAGVGAGANTSVLTVFGQTLSTFFVGGTAANSILSLKTTTGAGTTDAINILGGTNGAQTWAIGNKTGWAFYSNTNGAAAVTAQTSGSAAGDQNGLNIVNPSTANSAIISIQAGVGVGVNLGALYFQRNVAALDGICTLYTTDTTGAQQARILITNVVNGAGGGLFTMFGGILSNQPVGGVGYAVGAGGTVTQATSKATAFTLSKVTGTITMNGAALAANTLVSATWTNTSIEANDLVVVNHNSVGTLGAYWIGVTPGAGTATLNVRNITAGSLSEAIVIRFAIIKGAVA